MDQQDCAREDGQVLSEKHVQYFLWCYSHLPEPYIGFDTGRVTALYFVVHALDILGALSRLNRASIIEYVYSLQIEPSTSADVPLSHCGFIGGGFLGHRFGSSPYMHALCQSHLAMTYTALAILTTLGDDLSRVNKEAVVQAIRTLQQADGSFVATSNGSEWDMRFLYCACAISALLNDWSGVDTERAVSYVKSCVAWDGGLALSPGLESHGGSTYTGIASLVLMNRLSSMPSDFQRNVVRWCIMRQAGGYQGRCNKDNDTCYSFWVGATLKLLGAFGCTDVPSTRAFIVSGCQNTWFGGFGKTRSERPDVLHSFYSLTWLAMVGSDGCRPIDCRVAICADRLPSHLLGSE